MLLDLPIPISCTWGFAVKWINEIRIATTRECVLLGKNGRKEKGDVAKNFRLRKSGDVLNKSPRVISLRGV